ncbi:tuftelin interacting protein 11, putative [Eimeria tenella]|uniref:Tuftelin interacting protein 11, putative n=1 Tax=Eimeria tenella TaxID=5802 RepID=U6KPV1_EIMTE|nr:tuftelin interacting protein 11, putative [Eimeria tenella]CDJ38918.1 tuftelin interacting protein 11, putative [Eimeria tenella]|eukprot:XP_013229673.1 tuftelin interacting protein 11, putative [Eimeria tenella]
MGKSSRRARRKEVIYGCFGGSSSSDEDVGRPAAATAAGRNSKRRRRRSSSRSSSEEGSSGPIQFVKGGVLQPEDPNEKKQKSSSSSKKSSSSSSSSSSRRRDAVPQPFEFDKSQLKLSIKKPSDKEPQQEQPQQQLSSKDAHVLQQLGLDYSESEDEGGSRSAQQQQQQQQGGASPVSGGHSDGESGSAAAAAGAGSSGAASEGGSSGSESSSSSSSSSGSESEGSSSSRRSRSPAFVFKRASAQPGSSPGGDAQQQQQQQQGGWGQQQMQQVYGKGFALLQRMGFKGGALGKDGRGLVAPIEVKIRKKNRALQNQGERLRPGEKGAEPTKVVPSGVVGPDVFRWKPAAEAAEAAAAAEDGGVARISGVSDEWRTGKARSKRLVKTPAQIAVEGRMLLQQQQQQQQQQLRVIDMTGPQVRLLENAAEVGEALRQQQQQQLLQEEVLRLNGSSSSTSSSSTSGVPLQLLQQALRQQIRRVERDLQQVAAQKHQQEQELLDAAANDERQQQQQQQRHLAVESTKQLAAAVKAMYTRIKRRSGPEGQQQQEPEADRWSDDEAQAKSSSSSNSDSSSSKEPEYGHLTGGLTPKALLQEVLRWRDTWQEAFYKLHAAAAAAALLRLLLQRVCGVWAPLETAAPQLAASVGQWFGVYTQLHQEEEERWMAKLKQQRQQQQLLLLQEQQQRQEQLERLVAGRTYDLLQEGVEESVGAHMRRQLLNSWTPVSAAAAAAALLEVWLPSLPARAGRRVLQEPAVQQLRRSLDNWDPLAPSSSSGSSSSSSSRPVHQWLLPFVSLVERPLAESELLLPLQQKLVRVLSVHWKASDRSCLALLRPWRGVFSSNLWLDLLQRGVVPQLLQRLQQLEIRPQQQDLTPFNDVLLWESLLPTELLARVLHEGFMRAPQRPSFVGFVEGPSRGPLGALWRPLEVPGEAL